MAKTRKDLTVTCPCCNSRLLIDPALGAVISHEPPPKAGHDLGQILKGLGGKAAEREQKFKDQIKAEQSKSQVLDRKFQEGMKKAKDSPDPPRRPFDYD